MVRRITNNCWWVTTWRSETMSSPCWTDWNSSESCFRPPGPLSVSSPPPATRPPSWRRTKGRTWRQHCHHAQHQEREWENQQRRDNTCVHRRQWTDRFGREIVVRPLRNRRTTIIHRLHSGHENHVWSAKKEHQDQRNDQRVGCQNPSSGIHLASKWQLFNQDSFRQLCSVKY